MLCTLMWVQREERALFKWHNEWHRSCAAWRPFTRGEFGGPTATGAETFGTLIPSSGWKYSGNAAPQLSWILSPGA